MRRLMILSGRVSIIFAIAAAISAYQTEKDMDYAIRSCDRNIEIQNKINQDLWTAVRELKGIQK